jgi:hypothetical protein
MLQQLTKRFLNGVSALIQQVRVRLAIRFGRKPAPEPKPLGVDDAGQAWADFGPVPEAPAPEPDLEMLEASNRRERRRLEALRRQYEKARLRHDKFVEPQGEPPIPHARVDHPPKPPPAPQPEPEPDEDDVPDAFEVIAGGEKLIVDRHHEVGDRVLYTPEEFEGQFTFRDTILEQTRPLLGIPAADAQSTMRMPTIFIGRSASLLSMRHWGHWRDWDNAKKIVFQMSCRMQEPELPGWFPEQRPGFGCVSYGTNPLVRFNEIGTPAMDRRQRHNKSTMPLLAQVYVFREVQPPARRLPADVWWRCL